MPAVAAATVLWGGACWHRVNVVQGREGSSDSRAGQLPPDPSDLGNDRLFALLLVTTAVLTLALAVLVGAAWLRAATGVRRVDRAVGPEA